MAGFLDIALKISLVIFMAGSLLQMGLGLKVQDALSGLRDLRFLGFGVLFGFVISPMLAMVLTRIIPLEGPYAIGLLLLGLTPCAPFLPAMLTRAGGDMVYAPAMMLLAAVGTVILLPVAVPFVVPGLMVSPWTIAKPLIAVVLLPLIAGMALFYARPDTASALRDPVKRATAVATILMMCLCIVIYGKGFVGAVGSYAIGAQILFFSGVTVAAYTLSLGVSQPRRSVLGLGMCTRNVGAALAPLFSVASIDERAVVMVVLGVPMQIIFALMAAAWFARQAGSA